LSTTIVVTVVLGIAILVPGALLLARVVRKAAKAKALAAEVEAHRRMAAVDGNRSMPYTARRLRNSNFCL
jgi:hypothetical protein